SRQGSGLRSLAVRQGPSGSSQLPWHMPCVAASQGTRSEGLGEAPTLRGAGLLTPPFPLPGGGRVPKSPGPVAAVSLAVFAGVLVLLLRATAGDGPKEEPKRPHDAVADAQTPRDVPAERPEQKKSAHDRSDVFAPGKAPPITEALSQQTDQGQFRG